MPRSAATLAACAWWCCTPTRARAAARARVTRREVLRVKVVRDHLGRDAGEALHARHGLFEGRAGLRRLEVSDVRAQEGALAHAQAEAVLEVRAARQDRPHEGRGQPDRARHEAAGAAQQERRSRHDARHRVVAAIRDLAVVHQQAIGDAAQPGAGLVVGAGHRLVGAVAGGEHQRAPRFFREQLVERGVGQQQPQLGQAGRHRFAGRGPRGRARRASNTIGRSGEASSRAAAASTCAIRRASARSRTSTAKGFSSRALRSRSRATTAVRVASQARWKPPRPFSATIWPREQRRHGGAERVGDALRAAARVEPGQARPAGRAGVRLRVEAAVLRIRVLAPARGAHLEARHAGGRAVVGDVEGDAEARSAVRAVEEGVAVAAVARIAQLRQAGLAGGEVARDRGAPRATAAARGDREARRRFARDGGPAQLADAGRRRRSGAQQPAEGREPRARSEHLDRDAGGVVAHAARHSGPPGQPVHPGAEAHPLHGAADLDALAFAHRSTSAPPCATGYRVGSLHPFWAAMQATYRAREPGVGGATRSVAKSDTPAPS